jgi:SAM-dependent methyltransferase
MMSKQIKQKRLHDNIYLTKRPLIKESFKFLLKEILRSSKNFNSILDIGCSNGSFLYLVKKKMPKVEINGIDVRVDLLKLAKQNCKKGAFLKLDIGKNNLKVKKKLKFDICVMDGVHSIFDDVNLWIDNLIKFTKRNSKIFIFGSFNPEPYDVLVRVKKSNSKIFETGFNRISLESIMKAFKKRDYQVNFKKYDFTLNLKKNKKDPRRTYTVKLKNNQNLTINGLEQISNKFLIKAWKK